MHVFGKGNDGGYPGGGPLLDAAGNLYGTSAGAHKLGAVFELMPQADGSWREKILHTFDGTDGENPIVLTLDHDCDVTFTLSSR